MNESRLNEIRSLRDATVEELTATFTEWLPVTSAAKDALAEFVFRLAALSDAERRAVRAEKIGAHHQEIVADYVAQLEALDAERFAAEARVAELEIGLQAIREIDPDDWHEGGGWKCVAHIQTKAARLLVASPAEKDTE